jgi:hypothetical protein
MFRIVFVPVLLLFFVGCTLTTNPQTGLTVGRGDISTADLQSLQRTFMSSYYSNSGGFPTVARSVTPWGAATAASQSKSLARATIPVNTPSLLPSTKFSVLMANSAATNTITNYPETGESTSFTVTLYDSANHVYDIKATTTFPLGDTRSSYVEEYYVYDTQSGSQPNTTMTSWPAADGNWTDDDPIVQPNGSGGWTWNQNYRKQMLLTFTDGTTRNEYIISGDNGALSGAGGVADPHFEPFAVNGSLDMSQQFVPSITTTDSTIKFSSVVVYETHPATNPNFWFWSGSASQTIVGIRYYTEQLSGSTYTGTSVSFEKTVSTYTTTGGSYATALKTLNGGSTFNTLAQSVLREQISWPYVNNTPVLSQATITKNMQTQVINLANLSQPTSFYVTQLNADYAAISNFSTTAVYAPVGVIDGVVAANSSALLYTRNSINTGVNGALPLATATVSSGLGTLAQVYTAIQEGALANSATTSTPTSNVMPSGTSWSFNGQQSVGNTITPSATYQLGKTGWVEAWVYINTMTDTMGVVHYGSSTSFSDEGYSLQGWNANGQFTMVVDGPGGNYNQVLSNHLLSTGQWYDIVGVWDVTAATPYISLYINGALDNTATGLTSVIVPNGSQAATEAVPSPQVLIGSQLPSSYNAQWGYFGVNGKIVGVNIDTPSHMVSGSSSTAELPAPTAAQILQTVKNNYNANKGNTSGW